MSDIAISIENVSKSYRLGVIGTGTFYGDLKRWWARQLGKPDPYLKLGQVDHGNRDGQTIWAVKDVNISIKQGEAVGIIGRNGAGKSTLLKILSRVTAPTEGVIKVNGRIASLLEVGTGFHSQLTGRENIYLNGAINGMTRDEVKRKMDEIVAFSGVEQFIDTPVKRYSSGMYIRLAFSVAAHLDPDILVVDEVLAVGDTEFQKKCLGKMNDVVGQGRTVLFVSHNMAAVQALCQRGIVLQRGSMIFSGTQNEAIRNYVDSVNKPDVFLSDLSLRPGSGQIRITNAYLRDAEGHPLNAAQSGQEIFVCLRYKANKNYAGGAVKTGIIVYDQQGIAIFTHASIIQGLEFRKVPEEGVFICRIPRLPLPASNYFVECSVKVDNEYSDRVENVMNLEVIHGDFFGTGFFPGERQTMCLVDGEWSLE
ncbi:ABC transporter ATP-binding protein [Candidatus Villigracilis saccharophilus]|uniref:ABC transporter ATP-binding protein n=1 Tax=Candidatus Villigracilis saccharophilus TaxID=3140684 RepID=UPI0031368EEF|nr:ABC transporter ATP-binding protein [Anaerolineales bacterium]